MLRIRAISSVLGVTDCRIRCILNRILDLTILYITNDKGRERVGKIGKAVQMYTVRDEAAIDFAGTVRKIAQLGYDGIEFCGYGPGGAEELKKLLAELGIKAVSNHINMANIDQEIADAKTLGITYFATGSWNEFHAGRTGIEKAVEIWNEAGKKCAEQGIKLCYHNHDWEFIDVDGEKGLDFFYRLTDPKYVFAELDVFWVHRAGNDPAAYVSKYPGRVPVLHVKDASGDEKQPFAEVGHGSLDMPAVFKAAEAAGTQWFIVEQDRTSRTPFESIEMSVNYMKSQGY